jgi:valyl-tRNA synthetase
LGWPEKTKALATFYPNSVLETGFDIIFFWVARMIMMGIHFMGDVPFRKVYLHAMVRDEKGEKMSKSKGNVIDPLEVIQEHGADPLRFTLLMMAGQGRDIKLSVDRVAGYRAFCNKIWNATKFLLLQLEPEQGGPVEIPKEGLVLWIQSRRSKLHMTNRALLSSFERLKTGVEKGLENFELDESTRLLYEFTWKEYCDWSIEVSKPLLRSTETRTETIYVLAYVLDGLLKLMHPFIPFVTEQLWQGFPLRIEEKIGKSLMLQPYPVVMEEWIDEAAEKEFQQMKNIIEAIRNFRGENNIAPKTTFKVRFSTQNSSDSPRSEGMSHSMVSLEAKKAALSLASSVCALARVECLEFTDEPIPEDGSESVIPISDPRIQLRIPLHGLINKEEEKKRIQKEIEKITKDRDMVKAKLEKPSFIEKAPRSLVEKERARLAELEKMLSDLKAALLRL